MLKFLFSSCVVFVVLIYCTNALLLLAPQDTVSTMSETYNFTAIDDDADGLLESPWNLQVPQQKQVPDPTDEITLINDVQLPRKVNVRGRHQSREKDSSHSKNNNKNIRQRAYDDSSDKDNRKYNKDDKYNAESSTNSQLNSTSQERTAKNKKFRNRAMQNNVRLKHGYLGDPKMYVDVTKVSSTSDVSSGDTTQDQVPHSRNRRDLSATINRRRNSLLTRVRRRRYRTMRVRQYPRNYTGVMARIARPVVVQKRRPVNAKVGVLVVLDNSVYRQFLETNRQDRKVAVAKLRRYYGMVFAMMDERFRTIKDPLLSVTVRISGILIAETREESSWLEQIADWSKKKIHGRASVNTDKTLSRFSKWVSTRKDLPEYDHAMLFTAYRLSNDQDVGLGGMAYLNAICDTESGNSVSVVGDKGDFQCVKVATHELAHSLGAKHDGDPGCESCPSTANYVMSSLTTNKPYALKNAFYFSPCSIRDMISHLSKDKSKCVRNEPRVYYTYDIKRLPPGRIYNAHVQCKLIFGNRSEFCWEGNLPDIMCGQLWCRDPNLKNGCRTNSYLTALSGTQCGPHKVCNLGECVRDTFRYQDVVRQRTYDRSNAIPNIPRPSYRMRAPRRTRRHRNPYRSRNRSRYNSKYERRRHRQRLRRQNRCKGDKNARYCRGLIQLNPVVCKRKAVRQYCCSTCRRR